MTTKDELLRGAMALSADDRAELAEAIWDSVELSPQEAAEQPDDGWDSEILKRLEDVRSGRAKTVDGFELIRRAREEMHARARKK